MLINRLNAIVRRITESVVRNNLLAPKVFGFRHLRSIALREYCQSSGALFAEYSPARTVGCPLPVNVASREELSRNCGRYERSFYDVPDFHVQPRFSATIPDCRILRTRNEWGDDFYAIVTSDDQLVPFGGSSYRPEHAGLMRKGVISRSLEKVTWITTHSTRNHYMWLYTHLPRLILAEQQGLQDQILFPEESLLSTVKKSTLDRLGYQSPQFIRLDDEVIHVGQLSLMEIDSFDPWSLNLLRERLVRNVPESTPTRLYISREKCHYRKLKNETEVWPELEKMGFEKVFLEDLTLEQQIQKLRSADVVLGVHGAGFANVLFCRPGTQIIEIQDPDDPNPHFYALAALLGLSYAILHGKVNSVEEAHFRDVAIDCRSLTPLF